MLCGGTVHFKVTGVNITNQTLVIEPMGRETERASEDPIKAGNTMCALANAFTLGFNQVLCGEMGSPSCQG